MALTEKVCPSSEDRNGSNKREHAAFISGMFVGQVADIGVRRCADLNYR